MVYPLQHIDASDVSDVSILKIEKFNIRVFLSQPHIFMKLYSLLENLHKTLYDGYMLFANIDNFKHKLIVAFSFSKEELAVYSELNFPCAVLSECCA